MDNGKYSFVLLAIYYLFFYNTFMLPTFTAKVYSIAKQIPKGKVVTYGQLAKLAGSPGAARAVGMCMKHNPDMPTIPCHRVVSSTGALTGYSAGEGVSTKKQMLLQEGVTFINNRVDLAKSLWKGNK
jgi:methylated-DNA-protein-cysteine methyltransferase-like protein